ncbi:hypothetical protein A2630_03410 [Candidatus Woesebacteria bacterium RIFCSPHIGHO2_01_FULL_44_10]|uniref:Uncharacterized protein n=1 Tax=Candidatus Woesebacteria bacterium RIFCSPLOWO2_01_FULL_44_14 TaxID=1802525 RepID=A0A1F8BZ68_9BACT|nr:MAG: hypothetical protein A2630_03410 [Candidatus Woesebacteria bacterium RIFCSPHIGHO2_01_FULL_44_10]OGM56457.1 MAG: hypothetical protein A3F62_02070 [Candidatus Woesebacteria bacterium RIFCSPHIGHO2_12_FULL_44_11]OGM68859.1 MAG: hypothetical protein A2975_00615 [Candidatus Woesebacteria bacterium RIFCSPLOWO2_01_FULL_44_14]
MSHNVKLTIITVLIILVLALAGLATYFFVFKKTPVLLGGPEIATVQDLKNGTYRYFFEGEIVEINLAENQVRVKGKQGSILTFQVYSDGFTGLSQRPGTNLQDVPSEEEIAEEIRRFEAGEITLSTTPPNFTPPPVPTPGDVSYTQFLSALENQQATSLDQMLTIGDRVTVIFVTDYPPTQVKASNNKFIGPAEVYVADSIKK